MGEIDINIYIPILRGYFFWSISLGQNVLEKYATSFLSKTRTEFFPVP